MYIPGWLLALIILALLVFLVFVVIWIVRAHQRKVATGKEELVGKVAVAQTELNPKGMVLVDGEHWSAVLDSGRVEPEEEVVITRVDGLKLSVTRKK